jgi:hypothetical protein
MSTLKLEHISNISSSGNDLSIDTSGNLGIGTETPAQKLHVHNNSTTSSRIRLENNEGDWDWAVDDNDMYFANGGTDIRMYITASGNVGIGTHTPTEKFVVHGDGARMTISSNDH